MIDLRQTPAELETVTDFVRWAASRFDEARLVFGHGTANALDEAAALVLSTLHMPYDLPDVYWQGRLTGAERDAVVQRVRRRIEERMPLPYITHEALFAGLSFFVDERVLVPRSPIAELVEAGFAPWLQSDAVGKVLDLGTGSGCIGIACAHVFPGASVDLADVSTDALEVAAINVERHGLGGRVAVLRSDLFEGLTKERRYDLIVSNPPYVDAHEISALAPEFQHEPLVGLAAGQDGLDVVRRILREAGDYLGDDGILVVEVGNSAPALEAAFPEVPFVWLEFARGGDGVFLLTAEQLRAHRSPLVESPNH